MTVCTVRCCCLLKAVSYHFSLLVPHSSSLSSIAHRNTSKSTKFVEVAYFDVYSVSVVLVEHAIRYDDGDDDKSVQCNFAVVRAFEIVNRVVRVSVVTIAYNFPPLVVQPKAFRVCLCVCVSMHAVHVIFLFSICTQITRIN